MSTVPFAQAFDELQETHSLADSVRLVPSGAPVADEAGAIAEIRGHLELHGVPLERIARALGVGPSVLRLLFDDASKLPADARATLIRDAAAWCRSDAKLRELLRARYVPTAVTRLVVGLAETVRATKTIGLVTGTSGLGKSHALEAVRAELPGATLIVRADCDTRGARGLLRGIGLAAGSPSPAGSVKAGIDVVRASNGLLILDEGHLLSLSALEAARAVFDQADVGLLLCGTTALRRTLTVDADPLSGPLVSRIALRLDLDGELFGDGSSRRRKGWIDAATLRAIVARHEPMELQAEAAALLLRIADGHDGYLRTAVNAAKIAGHVARGNGAKEVKAKHVTAALAMCGITGVEAR